MVPGLVTEMAVRQQMEWLLMCLQNLHKAQTANAASLADALMTSE